MAVSSGMSFAVSSLLTVVLFSGMQMYRQWLSSSQLLTILGGYLGSVLFQLILIIPFNICTALLDCVLNLSQHAVSKYLLKYEFHKQEKAIGNLESTVFGKGFQTKLFPEVVFCLITAMIAAGMIHRVCTTTCLMFSLVALYYINRISQQAHAVPVPVQPVPTKKKK